MKKIICCLMIFVTGCFSNFEETIVSREESIPAHVIKITPEMDYYPPILHSDLWESPVSLPEIINTRGFEDSAFIMPEGNTLYFWFTPDGKIPPEKQLDDGVTGIYVAHKVNGEWGEVERSILQDKRKKTLDGCAFVQNNIMWFCSAREGFTGIKWFIAEDDGNKWTNWNEYPFDSDWQVGELHITADNKELYYHSWKSGGEGGLDVWMLTNIDGIWQTPENVKEVNSSADEGFPFITEDMNEMWITRTYLGSPALFRSIKKNGKWQTPELIISQFAGEASLDKDGNIYFTHHYFEDGIMLESDIYVAYKKITIKRESSTLAKSKMFNID